MMQATNTPYVKQYELQKVDGIEIPVLVNPITKENPYINDGSNRQNRKPSRGRLIHNGNRDSIVVHHMMIPDGDGKMKMVLGKYRKRKQYTNILVRKGGKVVKQYVGKMIVHNDLLTKPAKKEEKKEDNEK
jgi:hypothetical protein